MPMRGSGWMGSLNAPFPYFGRKSRIAHLVWERLGQPAHYIEPFCGTCAVLLARPDYDPSLHTETVNDADGHIANVWRALQFAPDEVAKWCDWPVNHADLMARKAYINDKTDILLENLCADPKWFDAEVAGYYIWAASCWIGSGLTRPGAIPHVTSKGMGVHASGQIPHLSCKGKGVHSNVKYFIYDWFATLSARLRNVRVVCGDWARVCGGDWQDSTWPNVGIFFDPPYSAEAGRDNGIYAVESQTVAHDVREWCRGRASRATYRICLAGYYDEHSSLLDEGWTVHQWKAGGGYGNTARSEEETQGQKNRHKEALFFSPHCVQPGLF